MSRLHKPRLWLACVGAGAALIVAAVVLIIGGVIGLDRGLESLMVTGLATLAGTGWFRAFQEHRHATHADQRLVAAQQATAAAALRDGVTGLANFRLFDASARKLLAFAQRYGQSFAILLVEVDGLAGNAAGERILKYLGSVLTRNAREADSVARVNDAMFALLLPDTAYEGAQQLWERLRTAALADWPEHRSWSIFGGAAGYTVEVGSVESLLSDADRRLALEKRRLRADSEP